MEKMYLKEIVENFLNARCVKYFKKHNNLNNKTIRWQTARSLLQYFEIVERGGFSETSCFWLGKKRLIPLMWYEVSTESIEAVVRQRLRSFPADFYRENVSTVYLARNKVTAKIYIGSTSRALRMRISEHKSHCKNPKSLNYNTRFSVAMRSFGFDSFEWDILEFVESKEHLKATENKWIQKFDSRHTGYNENHSYRKPKVITPFDLKVSDKISEGESFFEKV